VHFTGSERAQVAGKLTLEEAREWMALLETQRKALKTEDLLVMIEFLEVQARKADEEAWTAGGVGSGAAETRRKRRPVALVWKACESRLSDEKAEAGDCGRCVRGRGWRVYDAGGELVGRIARRVALWRWSTSARSERSGCQRGGGAYFPPASGWH
jgi:hypothetical protein